jgi:hypothetical protein
MQAFQNVAWTTTLHEEPIKTSDGQSATTAHWTISDWHIPFSFDEWASKTGIQMSEQMPTENIYEYCSKRLQRPIPKKLVADAATRLDLDTGFIQPHEKMASFYILKLLAGISRRSVWKEWTKVPVTSDMLKDEVFCLAVVALHPILYGKLHPIGRNRRRVFLEALARWDLHNYSIMQFVHPAAMQTFMGQSVTPFSIGYEIQAHSPIDQQYWLFDDTNVAVRAMGKPGRRRWFEMQFVGPSVVESIVKERQRHGNSIDTIEPYLKKNMYIKH